MPDNAIPADDPARTLTLANPATDGTLKHLSIAGGTYTILVTGQDTGGRYCLIDMLVPPGSGPPMHRHDFEEMFTVLEGQIELTFRGRTTTARVGDTVNIPANAPHRFRTTSSMPAHLLCMCTPAGQDEFFLAVGVPMDSRDAPPPQIGDAEKVERGAKAKALAAQYKTEFVPADF